MNIGDLDEIRRRLISERAYNINYVKYRPAAGPRDAENTQLARAIDALGDVLVLRAEEARDAHEA